MSARSQPPITPLATAINRCDKGPTISQRIEALRGDAKGAVKAIGQTSGIINEINDISNTIATAVEEQKITTPVNRGRAQKFGVNLLPLTAEG